MCGNEQALAIRGVKYPAGARRREKKGSLLAGEYRVPRLEEAYQDDSMRGAAYFGETIYRHRR